MARRQEAVRFLYAIPNPDFAARYLDELAKDLQDREFPPEVRSLGRTLTRWRTQLVAWHRSRATNGPAEAVILWSGHGGVFDVADGAGRIGGGRVLWSVSSRVPDVAALLM